MIVNGRKEQRDGCGLAGVAFKNESIGHGWFKESVFKIVAHLRVAVVVGDAPLPKVRVILSPTQAWEQLGGQLYFLSRRGGKGNWQQARP